MLVNVSYYPSRPVFLDILTPMDCNMKPGFIKDCGVAGDALTIIHWLKPFGLT